MQPIGRKCTYQRVRISAKFFLHQVMDTDNLTARLKWPVDSLVAYRVIPDDSPQYVTMGSIEQEVDRKHQRLELTLEALRDE